MTTGQVVMPFRKREFGRSSHLGQKGGRRVEFGHVEFGVPHGNIQQVAD